MNYNSKKRKDDYNFATKGMKAKNSHEKHEKKVKESFYRLYGIVKRLRAPDGCAWDREQSPSTLRKNLIEEAYECIDAIDQRDDSNLREELGDLYLLITMITEMKEEENSFYLFDVLDEISEKLIRRHPHVFGDSDKKTVPEILNQWDHIKETIEGKKTKESILERIPKSLPPLERAFEIQKKVAKAGFDWPSIEGVWKKIDEELEELNVAVESGKDEDIEEEFGDLLFTMVNLARFLKIDPVVSLNRANEKFIDRFQSVENELKRNGSSIGKSNLREMDAIWNRLKSSHQGTGENRSR